MDQEDIATVSHDPEGDDESETSNKKADDGNPVLDLSNISL